MKKLLLVAAFAAFGAVNAQMQKGTWQFGGTTTLGVNNFTTNVKVQGEGNVDGPKFTAFTLTPSAAYFVADNLAVGLDATVAAVGVKFDQIDEYDVDMNANTFSIMPTVRYYFYNEGNIIPYVSGGFGLATAKVNVDLEGENMSEKMNGYAWKLKGGIAWLLNKNVAVDLGLGYGQNVYNTNVENYDVDFSTGNLGVNAGFTIFLGKTKNANNMQTGN